VVQVLAMKQEAPPERRGVVHSKSGHPPTGKARL